MREASVPPIGDLDALGTDGFVQALAPLFEGAPAFAARLALDRPFGSYRALLERARLVALTMPEPEQVALLDAHPRIGAPAADVSALSLREQGYDREAGAAASDPEELARQKLAGELARLNVAYESRFGFRFVIHVAGRSRGEIALLMAEHLSADREEEIRRALDDVVDIAQDRLVHLRGAEAAG
ncbi:2-oxo-4-hydroxy-4-carboxy-5-ureidoimidazoline decarboxylase [soil metagenome]